MTQTAQNAPLTTSKPGLPERAPLADAAPATKRAIYALMTFTTVTGLLGTAFAPWLLLHAPLALVALNSGTQYVLLVAPVVSPWALVIITLLRRILSLLAVYWIGGLFGGALLQWTEQKYPRFSGFIRGYTGAFLRLGGALLFLAPLHSLAGIAGAAGYPVKRLTFFLTLGQIVQLVVLLLVGEVIAEWTQLATAWISEYIVPATAACVGLVVAQLVISRLRSGRWTLGGPRPSPKEEAEPAADSSRA